MFDAFELQPDVSATRKRFVVAFVAAAVTVGALGLVAAYLASHPVTETKEKQVDVSFRPPPPPPEPAKIETPPPPPPKPKVKPPPAPVVVDVPVAAPVAAPAPAAAPMVAPKEIPKKAAPESDVAVTAIQTAVGGKGDGTGSGVGSADSDGEESAAPVVAKAGSSGPVNLPEDAEPPEPSEDNAQPEYPEAARTTGQEARVVLKIVVEKNGNVGRIQVLKGEEPFVTAAISVVKTWTYSPATMDGEALAVFKIVNITFALRE